MTQKGLNLQESIWNSMLIWAKLYAIIKDDSVLKVFSKKFICEAIRYDIGQSTKAWIEVYLALF